MREVTLWNGRLAHAGETRGAFGRRSPGRVSTLTGDIRADPRVTLDVAEVRYLDTGGLRVLLKIRRACDSAGWTLAVVHVTSNVNHTVNISGLATIFNPQPVLPETDPTSPDPPA